ncbi:MAG: ornithine cyclodeaminase family protein [Thermaerobacter sp.]|nr:ornithine cyclodeaminase family protein [Thermaerobacter sp.]
MRYLGAEALRAALPPSLARRAIEGAFAAIAEGALEGPVRTSFAVAEGSSLLMPAVSRAHLGLKVLHLRSQNPAHGLPAIVGEFFLYLRATGELLAVLDGVELTGLRTAALAGHATALLAPSGAREGAIIGAGQQGYYQARALCEAAPIQRLRIWNRTPGRAAALAHRLRQELPAVEISIARDPAAAVADAQAVTLATASDRPLLRLADVPEEIHLNAMGAYRPDMAELAPDLLAGATQLLVDDVQGALAEAGDLLQAAAAGKVSLDALRTPWHASQPRSGITVFKSVGAAVFDLAVAEAALGQ